jgi:hypothetical protein
MPQKWRTERISPPPDAIRYNEHIHSKGAFRRASSNDRWHGGSLARRVCGK